MVTAWNQDGENVGESEIADGVWVIAVKPEGNSTVTFTIDGSDPSGAYAVLSGSLTAVSLDLTSRPTTYTLVDAAGAREASYVSWQGGEAISAVFEGVPNLVSVQKWQGATWLSYVSDPAAPPSLKADFSLSNGDTLFVVSTGPVILTLGVAPDTPLADPPEQEPPTDCAFVDGTARVIAATVQVITAAGAGTAFYLGNDEWVTAAHVVEGGGSIRLRTGTLDRSATLVGRDAAADLALLRASGAGLTPLTFGDHAALRVGQTLGMAGYPVWITGSPSVTRGLLSKVGEEGGITYLQTDAAANPGNSGGPLFTDCGAVVGVVVTKAADPGLEGLAWAVALPTIEEVLPRLRAGTPPPRGAEDESPLTITAFCNRSDRTIAAACRAGAADGLDATAGWGIWVRGVEDWGNVHYSIDGAPGARGRAVSLVGLAPGAHTVRIRELRAGGWTAWSAPNAFTIIAAQTAVLEIGAFCNEWWDAASATWQRPDTSDACRTAGAAGLRSGSGWDWTLWGSGGIVDWANVVYRFDGGAAFARGSAEDWAPFDALGPGQHTIEAREQRGGGWTAWSAPYVFTIVRDDRAVVGDWLWGLYDDVSSEDDVHGAIVDRTLAGGYSYGYAADLLMTFYRSMNAWHDALREEPLPALHGIGVAHSRGIGLRSAERHSANWRVGGV